jgi:hypothetical protein
MISSMLVLELSHFRGSKCTSQKLSLGLSTPTYQHKETANVLPYQESSECRADLANITTVDASAPFRVPNTQC